MDLRARRGSNRWYLGNWGSLLALNPPHAAAASALGILNDFERPEERFYPRAPFTDRARGMEIALRSRMDVMILGTRFFRIPAVFRGAPVQEGAPSDLEAR